MKYVILTRRGDYTSKLLLSLQEQRDVRFVFAEDLAATGTLLTVEDKIYLLSDMVFPLIAMQLDEKRRDIIADLRDKYRFRSLLAAQFPQFQFAKIDLAELPNHIFDFNKCARYIIKPVTGFMGAGARIVDSATNLSALTQDVTAELAKFSRMYPGMFTADIMIEEYIEGGDEYAVDMFYDAAGEPVIINIYCHPNAKRKEYLQMLYYTNADIFAKYRAVLEQFFRQLNQQLQVKSFPIHAEFKLNAAQQFVPVEFNSGRFGGMGLADLTYYAFGFHPVEYYFTDHAPVWSQIWQDKLDTHYCWILAYNGAGIDIHHAVPNHVKFKALLPRNAKLLAYHELDYLHAPGFALAYVATQDKDDLEQILNIEFDQCFDAVR